MAEGKKWFLYGCFGCLGIVGLIALAGGILAVTALHRVRTENVQERVLTQAVQPAQTVEVSGRVVLDLARAEFHIEPARPGQPMRVEATYDESSFELTERFEEQDDSGWSYEVGFRGKSSNLMNALRMVFGGSQPEVRIYLPMDVPFDLELKLDQGGANVDLGGLWLTEADLSLTQGGFQIDVDRPLRQPMERLELRGSMGGMQVSRLGNASPRELDVEFSMGGLELDLRGQWMNDSNITLGTSMGGAVIRLPRDVLIEGLATDRIRPPEVREIDPPTLRFEASSSMGDVEIVY